MENYIETSKTQAGNLYLNANGQIHRIDGPAIELKSGYKAWYKNGELHRIDGPAVEYADGSKLWYLDGLLHNTNGPAIEWSDGIKEYWINNEEFSYEEFLITKPF